jgi:16S rRNA (adenine1518-N6/adenine1519-N6)-dimethyltransferase
MGLAAGTSPVSARLKKHLGQHFLHDRDVLARIVRAIDPRPEQRLVEIGPGDGAMTLPLLDAAGALTAIELDRDLHEPLMARAAPHGRLELIRASVLDVDFTALARQAGGPLRVVGNLPYYLSSPILFHCADHLDAIADMHFMLQREVVERIVAEPGGKDYGRLSVMLQLACEAELLLHVPPAAFRPPPKVDSAVVRLVPRPQAERPRVGTTELAAMVRAAFGQRRKTLANALRGVLDEQAIRAAGIDPRVRAETLPPQAFVALARQRASTG